LSERANAKRTELLDSLPGREFGDIAIRPFERYFEGVQFALVDESEPDRGDRAELYPDRLGFHVPWNGRYST
jgi:formate hydrogenlyase regulatory protein HycA